MTKTITASTGSFDQVNTFSVALPPIKRFGEMRQRGNISCYLFICEDGLYALKNSVCLKSSYTAADTAERDRLAAMEPLADGEVVEIDGKSYRFKLNGDFSDAGMFIAI